MKRYGTFEPRSVFAIFVVMDHLLNASNISSTWLSDQVWPHLSRSPLAARGLMTPRKYGQMDLSEPMAL